MKNIKPIKTETDYDAAIVRINQLLDRNPKPGSEEDHELDILSTLVEAYEDDHYPILPPDPVDAIRVVMEEKGLDNKVLIPLLGSKSRVSEIMNRKKPFTLKMIYNVHKVLGLPLEIFINDRMLKDLTTQKH
jgi:HTH-type transcriptional regulator / antitoxin HigA